MNNFHYKERFYFSSLDYSSLSSFYFKLFADTEWLLGRPGL